MILAAVLVVMTWPSLAGAQQRPLVTEDPETAGEGQVLVEAGLDYQHGAEFPASGLKGNLLRVPLVGVSVGVSSIAEIQIDGGLINRFSITERVPAPLSSSLSIDGDNTSSAEDLVVGAKVRLVGETATRPGFGVRFATKLPFSSPESGLGQDTTEFYASLLAAKTVQSVRMVFNFGLGMLGDPTRVGIQSDVLTYGVSFARAATASAEVVAELNGRANFSGDVPPPGTESRSMLRLGARYTRGTVRADGALLFGVTNSDPAFGVTAGLTYVFNAFRVP
ncbi:MAG: hypothetical protein HOP16_13585 [Acidobacteria bacterium]|nr:hypothetical protein [Acidobacteriota bacterium]